MDKLKMHSLNKIDENIEKISYLFPNILTEVIKGYDNDRKPIVEQAIDFDMLKQELSNVVVDGNQERYQFTWPDKKKSILLANAPISKTLRPYVEESIDFDSTENLYIEGDNLEVLKLLQETYMGKIKMIYIDPPYNTGNDFIYEDDFTQNVDEYISNSGQLDKDGNKLVQNTESNGRFHTDWLNMMYPRLKLAKDLISDDGLIFISIDDNECENLKRICNEILGEQNYIAQFVWVKKKKGSHLSNTIRSMTEYVLCFSKNKNVIELYGENAYIDKLQPLAKRTNSIKTLKFGANVIKTTLENGEYKAAFYGEGTSSIEFLNDFYINEGFVTNEVSVNGPFVWTQQKLLEEIKLGTEINLSKKFGFNVLRSNQEDKIKRPSTLIDNKNNVGTNEDAYSELIELFDCEGIMNYPKPVSLIKYLVNSITYFNKDVYVLDFFSGSSTTAHAVMQLNAEDGGNRKFIMVQLPEETDKKSEAYKAGYKDICEIGKERIKRAGKKIKEETGKDIDYGFRVLKIDSSNMKDVYYEPDKYDKNIFDIVTDNIKEDRTPEDLLFQVMLDLGVLLSSEIEEINIGEKKVFSVADDYLIACFDTDITDEVVKQIAIKKPYYAIFRDSCMVNDSVQTNFEQIFNTYSPSTLRKVL